MLDCSIGTMGTRGLGEVFVLVLILGVGFIFWDTLFGHTVCIILFQCVKKTSLQSMFNHLLLH